MCLSPGPGCSSQSFKEIPTELRRKTVCSWSMRRKEEAAPSRACVCVWRGRAIAASRVRVHAPRCCATPTRRRSGGVGGCRGKKKKRERERGHRLPRRRGARGVLLPAECAERERGRERKRRRGVHRYAKESTKDVRSGVVMVVVIVIGREGGKGGSEKEVQTQRRLSVEKRGKRGGRHARKDDRACRVWGGGANV